MLKISKNENNKKIYSNSVKTETVNDDVNVKLSYGGIDGTYYSKDYPIEEFDTEDEAIEYAFIKNKWCSWLIIPIVKFDNF